MHPFQVLGHAVDYSKGKLSCFFTHQSQHNCCFYCFNFPFFFSNCKNGYFLFKWRRNWGTWLTKTHICMPSEKNCLFPHHSLFEKNVIQIFNSLSVSGKLFYLFILNNVKKKEGWKNFLITGRLSTWWQFWKGKGTDHSKWHINPFGHFMLLPAISD